MQRTIVDVGKLMCGSNAVNRKRTEVLDFLRIIFGLAAMQGPGAKELRVPLQEEGETPKVLLLTAEEIKVLVVLVAKEGQAGEAGFRIMGGDAIQPPLEEVLLLHAARPAVLTAVMDGWPFAAEVLEVLMKEGDNQRQHTD